MSTHTPEPWKAVGNTITGTRGSGAQDVAMVNIGWPEETFRANARLIAAAPELLAACKDLVGGLCPGLPTLDGSDTAWIGNARKRMARARAAIAKTEGR